VTTAQQIKAGAHGHESKRRHREWIAVVVAAVTLVAFVAVRTRLPPLAGHTSLVANLVVIMLFDLSVLLLGVLLFLVGRNLAKVIFERRRGRIGSRLQARMVAGFIATALFPAVFLLYVAQAFLRADVQSWFRPQYEQVLDDSLLIAEVYYLNSANNAVHFARVLAHQISAAGLLGPGRRAELKRFVERRQQEYNLGTIEVFGSDRRLLLLALTPRTPTGVGLAPDSPLLALALKGKAASRTESLGKADVIRGAAPIYAAPESDAVMGAVAVDYYLPRSLSRRAADVSRAFENYFQLRTLRQPILRSYLLALVLIALVVVLLASWFGIFLARGITGPIKLLAEGTQAVARGQFEHRIPAVGDDEIGRLVASFNRMTEDLLVSRAELDRRRLYTETLLRNVSAGVVGLDPGGRLTMLNPCAERLLGLGAAAVGRPYGQVLAAEITRILDDLCAAEARPVEARASVKVGPGAESELLLTVTSLGAESGENLGMLLFLEDISQLAKIERMEAWREVARRIAHEIKNPLTPIQLSAERLARHLPPCDNATRELVEGCVRTVVGEVRQLKRLVDEFSAFARMPHLDPRPGDLNALAREAVENFQQAHPGVEFRLGLASELPLIAIDRDGLKRALVNLLDNAAFAARDNGANGQAPCVEVTTAYAPASGTVMLEVSDNGRGIDARLRSRIFEPYFSTRQGGTGLGLAIVSAIVADHHGFVRVRDNQPAGSRFVLEFPVRGQPAGAPLA
jgi:two-component system nitrogen regulation sensor histidine kinase NtrY